MSREVNLESFHHAELIRKRFPTVYFTAEFQRRLVQAAKEKGHDFFVKPKEIKL